MIFDLLQHLTVASYQGIHQVFKSCLHQIDSEWSEAHLKRHGNLRSGQVKIRTAED
jgi:hypothetical protein